MTSQERAFWNGFIKAAELPNLRDQEIMDAFNKKYAPPGGYKTPEQVADASQAESIARVNAELEAALQKNPAYLKAMQHEMQQRAWGGQVPEMAFEPTSAPDLEHGDLTPVGVAPSTPEPPAPASTPTTQPEPAPAPHADFPPARTHFDDMYDQSKEELHNTINDHINPTAPINAPAGQPQVQQPGFNWKPWAVGGAATLGAAGLGAWYLNHRQKQQQQAKQQPPVNPMRPKNMMVAPKPIE